MVFHKNWIHKKMQSRPCSCWFSGRELLKTDVAEEEKLAKDGILTSRWTPTSYK